MSWVDEYHVSRIELERERDRWREIAYLFAESVVVDAFGRLTGDPGGLARAHRLWVDEVRRDADRGGA
jgi:hypothetical protein